MTDTTHAHTHTHTHTHTKQLNINHRYLHDWMVGSAGATELVQSIYNFAVVFELLFYSVFFSFFFFHVIASTCMKHVL